MRTICLGMCRSNCSAQKSSLSAKKLSSLSGEKGKNKRDLCTCKPRFMIINKEEIKHICTLKKSNSLLYSEKKDCWMQPARKLTSWKMSNLSSLQLSLFYASVNDITAPFSKRVFSSFSLKMKWPERKTTSFNIMGVHISHQNIPFLQSKSKCFNCCSFSLFSFGKRHPI